MLLSIPIIVKYVPQQTLVFQHQQQQNYSDNLLEFAIWIH